MFAKIKALESDSGRIEKKKPTQKLVIFNNSFDKINGDVDKELYGFDFFKKISLNLFFTCL